MGCVRLDLLSTCKIIFEVIIHSLRDSTECVKFPLHRNLNLSVVHCAIVYAVNVMAECC